MKKLMFCFGIITLLQSISAQERPVDFVDPMVGTHDSRWNMFPGPTRPFGMVKLSPDNQELGWKAGYEYTIENISGFSHIHSWTMAGLRTMPTTGALKIQEGTEKDPDRGYRSRFSHKNEKAEAGYYSVILDDYNVKAELTTTTRTGFQRYTFPESKEARILVDLLIPSEYGYEIFYTQITKVSDYEIEGVSYQQSLRKAQFNDYTLNFVMRFNKPFKSFNGWVKEDIIRNATNISSGFGHKDVGAFVEFDTKEGEQIMVQTGISLVSIPQARLNLETELDAFNWDFDAVKNDSQTAWNNLLNKITVEDPRTDLKKKFYTNMYRAYAGRSTWSDVNGTYMDMNEKVQQLKDASKPLYASDAFWGTYWNLNQLWSLATPNIANNWVNSILEIYDKGGWLPKGATGIEYSGIMVASDQIALITNAYHKGIKDYDVEKAYEAIVKLQKEPGHLHKSGGYVGNRNLKTYIEKGYVPDEEGPASNTLAYAYNDYTVGQFSKALGKEKDYKEFTKRAYNYRHVFDKTIGFTRRKRADGSWVPNFKPFGDVAWLGSGFVEGNAWQYTYFVPHDINGLINLMGKETFNNRLQEGFETSAKHNFNSEHLGSNSLDGMGVLPINHGNQPNMQAAYLFNYSGKPWLTQKWVNEIRNKYYGNDPIGGWKGDEDQGQMGAWYVMSAMGLFQMDGGTSINPIYEIGSPQFKKITLKLDPKYYPGGTFVIEAKNVSSDNIYIQSAKLNGKPLNKPWFYHSDLINGGKLILKMGSKPNKKWGAKPENSPPSLSTLISKEEQDIILAYDRLGEELAEWNKAIKAYYYHKKEHFESLPDTENEIIFLGNSITDGAEWSELFQNPNIKNRGIGGDDTDGVLGRLEEVTSSNPKQLFIMIGTNDLAYGKTVDYINNNYVTILDTVKKQSPNTEIFIQSILPVDDNVHSTRPNKSIRDINRFLKQLCAERNINYIDLNPVFADEHGKLNTSYSIDGLHLNGKGYLVWKKEIEKFLK
ncbi:GH92 family glycosyl hydrolase [Flavivirga eckloniae]|uniref:Glycoside hydrolase family 92 protein n=1 Tax=Flavivirga eckloniae TaxID=1803846 RepID=A0A2K9PU92_9FLAO|nr:GH92 family glycosyl hydrolase [Flavivirga eckloniae]AUP80636.1 glycoside hydrolase family 92 protein [Flavivirga eckloniae]